MDLFDVVMIPSRIGNRFALDQEQIWSRHAVDCPPPHNQHAPACLGSRHAPESVCVRERNAAQLCAALPNIAGSLLIQIKAPLPHCPEN